MRKASLILSGIIFCFFAIPFKLQAAILSTPDVVEEEAVVNGAQQKTIPEKQQVLESEPIAQQPGEAKIDDEELARTKRRELNRRMNVAIEVGDAQGAKKLQQQLRELNKKWSPSGAYLKIQAEEKAQQEQIEQSSTPLKRSDETKSESTDKPAAN